MQRNKLEYKSLQDSGGQTDAYRYKLTKESFYYFYKKYPEGSKPVRVKYGDKLEISVKKEFVPLAFNLIADELVNLFYAFKIIKLNKPGIRLHHEDTQIVCYLYRDTQGAPLVSAEQLEKFIKKCDALFRANKIPYAKAPPAYAPTKSPYFYLRNDCDLYVQYISAKKAGRCPYPVGGYNPFAMLLEEKPRKFSPVEHLALLPINTPKEILCSLSLTLQACYNSHLTRRLLPQTLMNFITCAKKPVSQIIIESEHSKRNKVTRKLFQILILLEHLPDFMAQNIPLTDLLFFPDSMVSALLEAAEKFRPAKKEAPINFKSLASDVSTRIEEVLENDELSVTTRMKSFFRYLQNMTEGMVGRACVVYALENMWSFIQEIDDLPKEERLPAKKLLTEKLKNLKQIQKNSPAIVKNVDAILEYVNRKQDFSVLAGEESPAMFAGSSNVKKSAEVRDAKSAKKKR